MILRVFCLIPKPYCPVHYSTNNKTSRLFPTVVWIWFHPKSKPFPFFIYTKMSGLNWRPTLALILLICHHFADIFCLDTPPTLECQENAMRLHFLPDRLEAEDAPAEQFSGHVYLKGFFFSGHCHLDYSRLPINQPFYMHIPYRSECQVKRERSTGGGGNGGNGNGEGGGRENAAGVTYSIVVIVQHHRLFVTSRDKAYSVTCFYRDAQREFERGMEVGDLSPSDIGGERAAPTCQYEVLRAAEAATAPAEGQQPESVRFANIGEQLVHRWSCDTEEMGMLVHSCNVRDGLGHSFPLVDERGCATESSLMPQLEYTAELNSSSTGISAFKFADQMVVYFRCQITLCDKRDNGCEGITPPVCQLIPLPNEEGPPMPVRDSAIPSSSSTHRPSTISSPVPTIMYTSHQRARTQPKYKPRCCQQQQNGWKWQPLPAVFGQGMDSHQRMMMKRESAMNMNSYGLLWKDKQQQNGTNHHNRPIGDQSKKKEKKLITVDVVADGLIVFTRDEGPPPNAEERSRLLQMDAQTQQQQQRNQFSAQCAHLVSPLWALTGLALLPLLILALFIQRLILNRRIRALSTFTPSYPVEMSGFPSAFGQSPVPKPRQYGRL